MPTNTALMPKVKFPANSFEDLVHELATHKDLEKLFAKDPATALATIGIKVPAGIKYPSASPYRQKQDPDDPGPDPDGTSTAGGEPVLAPLTPGDLSAGANGWGIVFTLSHNAALTASFGAKWISQALSLAGELFPPASFVIGLVSAFISLNGELIKAVDVGKGVYLTVPWLLPGVVVPTSR